MFPFAVIVSFAQSEYETEESDESGIPITVLAQGDLSSELSFSIPLAVISGTATGMWGVLSFASERSYFYSLYIYFILHHCAVHVHNRLQTQECNG